MHSGLLYLHSCIPPRFYCIQRHKHLSSLCHWLQCWPNQFRNIWGSTQIPLLWAFRILDTIAFLYIRFSVCRAIVFGVIWIIQVTFQFSQSSVSGIPSSAQSSSLSTGCRLILGMQRTFNIWVRPPGRSFVDNTGGNGNISDCSNTAAPSCWERDQDALTISSMAEMYPTAVICVVWAKATPCVLHRFWPRCHFSKKVMDPGHSVLCVLFGLVLHFRVIFSICCMPCWVIACQNPIVGLSKLPYNDFFTKGLTCGSWLTPADNISPKGRSGLHSNTMCSVSNGSG